MTELCPVQTSFKIRYLCPYLPLLLQKLGCKPIFHVASGSLMISLCPVLNITKIHTRTVNTLEQLNGEFGAEQLDLFFKDGSPPGKGGCLDWLVD